MKWEAQVLQVKPKVTWEVHKNCSPICKFEVIAETDFKYLNGPFFLGSVELKHLEACENLRNQ